MVDEICKICGDELNEQGLCIKCCEFLCSKCGEYLDEITEFCHNCDYVTDDFGDKGTYFVSTFDRDTDITLGG